MKRRGALPSTLLAVDVDVFIQIIKPTAATINTAGITVERAIVRVFFDEP